VSCFSIFSLRSKKFKIHNTIILPVVLYVHETWSPTLSEKHRLTVYVKRVLRRIFGSKRKEVAGGWRRLHNEEPHNLYASPNTWCGYEVFRMISVNELKGAT